MHREYVIIGGGVAGLSAAIKLAEGGVSSLVIEGGNYPCHKVCGEFLSPESVQELTNWKLPLISIEKMHFHYKNKALPFSFPKKAGSLSHMELDPELARYVIALGGEILTEEKVESLNPLASGYELYLSSGKTICADHVIIATGRIPSFSEKMIEFPYVGVKAHFEGVKIHNTLEMFFRKGAYLGVSPIERNRFNVAALISSKELKQTPKQFMDDWIKEIPLFSNSKRCFEWMTVSVPKFGVKRTPMWPNVYFIGDAAATVPPITGNGLSFSILGASLVAEYAIKKDWQGFRKAWKKKFSSSVYWGKLLHHAALSTVTSKILFRSCQMYPAVASYFYRSTRTRN